MAVAGNIRRKPIVTRKLWVSYQLQSLSPKRFIVVTNKIIQGEHSLVSQPRLNDAL